MTSGILDLQEITGSTIVLMNYKYVKTNRARLVLNDNPPYIQPASGVNTTLIWSQTQGLKNQTAESCAGVGISPNTLGIPQNPLNIVLPLNPTNLVQLSDFFQDAESSIGSC